MRDPPLTSPSHPSLRVATASIAAVLAFANVAYSADENKPETSLPTTAAAQPPANVAGEPNAVAQLEQLLQSPVEVPALQQEVTTVSGQESTVGKSPAAVFVITQEMIRRSGATSTPEALRMAPGIQVARINANQWAVTARGFNANLAGLIASNNKLLVLIDGRTVFSPFYNGTFWDVQDLILADIERIEVIRGPGATIWGANAVNGVVNIITKRAADTQGGLIQAGAGTEERGFTNARVGGQSGEDVHYRIYGRWFDRDSSFDPTGFNADDWRQGRGGFRVDWTPTECDLFTLQGDMYEGQTGFFNTLAPVRGDDERVSGGDLLARWSRDLGGDNDVSLQLYYDRADRANSIALVDQEFNTYDAELRHHFHLDDWHNIVWGLGYRIVRDRITALTPTMTFDPSARMYDTFSFFVQDEIEITDAHYLTVGAKLQHNDFTGWEVQPTIRLLYSPENSWAAWGAISRAVRTPSRIESDATIFAPGAVPFLDFVPTFDSEELVAYEIGYRSQPEPWFSWDVAGFFNQYDNLSSLSTTPVTVLPLFNTNRNYGEGYGAELSATVEMLSHWRVSGGYSFVELQIHPGTDTGNFLGSTGELVEGSTPHNQVFLMSSHDLASNFDFDLLGRYVDNLPAIVIASYIELDARLAYRPGPRWEIAIVGQNLLQPHHPEYATAPRYEIERGVYGSVSHTW
jgi:iron complex outermembrane recepter protein